MAELAPRDSAAQVRGAVMGLSTSTREDNYWAAAAL
jgi:hypothetical protein